MCWKMINFAVGKLQEGKENAYTYKKKIDYIGFNLI